MNSEKVIFLGVMLMMVKLFFLVGCSVFCMVMDSVGVVLMLWNVDGKVRLLVFSVFVMIVCIGWVNVRLFECDIDLVVDVWKLFCMIMVVCCFCLVSVVIRCWCCVC